MQIARSFLFFFTLTVSVSANANLFKGGGEALVREATQWVSQETGLPETSITMSAPDRTVAVEPCEHLLNFRFPFKGNQRTLEASCKKPQWKRFIRVQIEEGSRRLAATKPLNAGHILTSSDIDFVSIGSSKNNGFSDPKQLIGMTLKIAVDSNTVIEPSMVMSEIAIFVTDRAYEAGEVIERESLIKLAAENPEADALTSWPTGIITALEYLEKGQTLSNSSIELSEAVVVSATNIVRGQVIDKELIEIQLRPRQQLGAQTLSSIEEALGLEATRTIRAGTPLTISDLVAADLVRKGEKVTLTVSRGALTITVDTIAMEDGKMGEQVELTNSESGRVIRGVVTGRHQAKGISP